jgi:hypothetical protein
MLLFHCYLSNFALREAIDRHSKREKRRPIEITLDEREIQNVNADEYHQTNIVEIHRQCSDKGKHTSLTDEEEHQQK